MATDEKRRKVPPPALVQKANDAVERLDIHDFLKDHWPALFGKLVEADQNAQTTPIDADMMFIVLSLPIASSVIHLASSRLALANSRQWVAAEWGPEADPVPILSALTLARIAIEGQEKNRDSEVWERIMARVAELTDDLTDSAGRLHRKHSAVAFQYSSCYISHVLSSETRLLLLVAACAALWSLESIVPLYERENRLRRAMLNVVLTVLLVLTNLALSFITALTTAFADSHPLHLPVWAELLVGVAALDFFTYAAHVALHRLPLAWRFHRVHHSDEEVDVTTAFRQHPGETVWRVLWQLPAILLLGIPLWVVVVYLTISTFNAQLEHANVRVPASLDRVLRLFVVTPDMHKVHHSRRQPETDSNYGNILPLWDRLFGTYTPRVDFETLRYGLDNVQATRLRTLLTLPFAR